MATYGGSNIFGRNVRVAMSKNPSAEQLNSFFGVNGVQRLFGGQRGIVLMVEGTLAGSTWADLGSAEVTILSYEDGIGRTFEDSFGLLWPQVVFRGEYSRQGKPFWDGRGYYQDYKAVFHGLLG